MLSLNDTLFNSFISGNNILTLLGLFNFHKKLLINDDKIHVE